MKPSIDRKQALAIVAELFPPKSIVEFQEFRTVFPTLRDKLVDICKFPDEIFSFPEYNNSYLKKALDDCLSDRYLIELLDHSRVRIAFKDHDLYRGFKITKSLTHNYQVSSASSKKKKKLATNLATKEDAIARKDDREMYQPPYMVRMPYIAIEQGQIQKPTKTSHPIY